VTAAVVFDLDGVLLDSEQVWNEAKRELVEEHGGRWREQAPRDMMGMSSPEWSRYPPAAEALALADDVLGSLAELDPARVAGYRIREAAPRDEPLLEAMLEHALRQAKEAGHREVSLSVEPDNPALRLYERLGFERVGKSGGSWTLIRRSAP
jgi:beta-phosphoglucomutase-like phosphatase (HAD superfamily)